MLNIRERAAKIRTNRQVILEMIASNGSFYARPGITPLPLMRDVLALQRAGKIEYSRRLGAFVAVK